MSFYSYSCTPFYPSVFFFFSTRLITAYKLSISSWNREMKCTFQLFKIIFLRKPGEFFFSFILADSRWIVRGTRWKNTKFRLFFVGTWNISFSRKKIYGVKFFLSAAGIRDKKFKIFALVASPFYDALVTELPSYRVFRLLLIIRHFRLRPPLLANCNITRSVKNNIDFYGVTYGCSFTRLYAIYL